jgi:hypothetical protein
MERHFTLTMQLIRRRFEGKDRLYYPVTPSGLLQEHLADTVYELQIFYKGIATVSRTPGGLVIHKIVAR